jgi:hypothetical protein
MADIFISASSKDRATAYAVCERLEKRSITCWVAPRDVRPGRPYGEEIVNAIRESKGLVLVFSANANASPHVPREVELAAGFGVPIIPFRIEDVAPAKSLEYFIHSVHWLDAITPPLEQHIDSLANTIAARHTGATVASRVAETGLHVPVQPTPIPLPLPMPTPAQGTRQPRRWWPVVAVVVVIALVVAAASWYTLNGPGASKTADQRASAAPANVAPPAATPTPVVAPPSPPPVADSAAARKGATEPGAVASNKTGGSTVAAPPQPKKAAEPAAKKPTISPAARCARLMERTSLGEVLTAADKDFMRKNCGK